MSIDQQPQPRSFARGIPPSFVLAIAVVALVAATIAVTMSLMWGLGMMRGPIVGGSVGMMGRGPAAVVGAGLQPGDAGFVAGTTAAPRIVRVLAGPGTTFWPASIRVARGETITFEVTVMGPTVHEFMVGPADAVAADLEGTPEIADLGMMQTRSLTTTFDGSGPYAYACHAPGHYEAGMRGAIVVVG